MNTFEELEAWKVAREFRIFISDLIVTFPAHEKYKLCNQITRSVRSVGNNIAEGFGRYHFQENIQFCRQARGSLFETLDHLIIALDEKYIDQEKFDHSKLLFAKNLKILNGYINYLQKAKSQSSGPKNYLTDLDIEYGFKNEREGISY